MSDQDSIWGDEQKETYEESFGKGPMPPPKKGQSGSEGRMAVLIVFMVLLAGFGIAILAMVGTGMALRSAEPYQIAFEAARNDPQVIAALGQPLEMGWPVTGELTLSGISGTVDVSGPIHGPNGRGTLYVAGRKENGVWTFYTLSVRRKDTGTLIVLNP